MKNPGLNNILKYLRSERQRFLKASESGMFCDSDNCENTALAIKWTICDLESSMEQLGFDIEED